jgi:hypothetical protein
MEASNNNAVQLAETQEPQNDNFSQELQTLANKKKKKAKKSVVKEEATPIAVSEEFDKLSTLVKESLIAFRQGVEDFSMKELRRTLISVVESPLEQTVYKKDKDDMELFNSHEEERIVKLARAIKFWMFQMFFEQLKNGDKFEQIREKVQEFNNDQVSDEVKENGK